MSQSTPLVSAVVPTYNGAEFLRECFDSLLAQDMENIEVLIADDGSTDETLEIAHSYSDPRLRVLPFDTRVGMASNWNRGFASARGKYVSLVGQDDTVAPQWARLLSELLEAHPESSLAFGHREFGVEDEDSRRAIGDFFATDYPAMLEKFYGEIGTVISSEDMVKAAMEYRFRVNLIGEPTFTLHRRDHPVIRQGYKASMGQLIDWEFLTRFFCREPIVHCTESLGTFRIHAEGSSAKNTPVWLRYQTYKNLIDGIFEDSGESMKPEHVQELRETRLEIETEFIGHARALEDERDQLSAHALTLEEERRHLVAHTEIVNADLVYLRERAEKLDRTLAKLHLGWAYRGFGRLKDLFGGAKPPTA